MNKEICNSHIIREYQGNPSVGVVLVHEIFGITEYTRSVAGALSEQGYQTMMVDLFEGNVASTLEEGLRFASRLERTNVLAIIGEGLDRLRERLGPATPIGSMGFCMGGGYALLGACNLDLSFCVDYYGMIQDAEEVKRLKGPVQLILGSDDNRVPSWAYTNFLPSMTTHKKRVDVHLYPHAKHAFHRPGWEGHNPEAAKDAWAKTLWFLSQFAPENNLPITRLHRTGVQVD
jgi:carboxymethylenebutenolidase